MFLFAALEGGSMQRRGYLAAVGAAMGVVGCSDMVTSAREPGDTVTHQGLKMTASNPTPVEQVDGVGGRDFGDADAETILLTVDLSASHTGESRTWPPWPALGFVWLSYDGDERDTLSLFEEITAAGQTGPSWEGALRTHARDEYLYPGAEPAGRVVFRVARGFDPSLANLSVRWGAGDAANTATWTLEA